MAQKTFFAVKDLDGDGKHYHHVKRLEGGTHDER